MMAGGIWIRPLFALTDLPVWGDGEGFVIYNPCTGGTHFVSDVGMAVLETCSAQTALPLATLTHKVQACFDYPDHSTALYIQEVIQQLCGFGFLLESEPL